MAEHEIARRAVEAHFWGWQIPVYLFLGGMAAGVMILSALLALKAQERSPISRALAFAPPLIVSVGMGALFLDLELKLHVLRFYTALRVTSPMSWGAWILALVYPASLLFALRPSRAVAWTNLAAGVLLGVYTGVLLSTLAARSLWSSALLGPLFLVSGLSSGAAFLLLFKLPDHERHFAARWDLIALALEAALLVLFFVGLVTSGEHGREAAALLLGGRFTAQFWTLVVLAGLAVPWLLEWLELRLSLKATAVAPALVLLGGFSLRFILVSAGQM